MPTTQSSLSVAVQATADFIAGHMEDDVVVTVDSPQRAQKQAEDANTHILNVFVYRIAPSGFHADMGHEDPTFIRANVLLTAFPAGQGDPPPDSDLRVLGQAVRVLQSFPVIPTLLSHGNAADPLTQYQLQAVMQAPTMEELNHIWTTQGGELAYRLSSAYELALIPIEPMTHAAKPEKVTSTAFELAPGNAHSPFQMFADQGRLFSHHTVAAGTANTPIMIAGEPVEPGVDTTNVSVTVSWTRAAGTADVQPSQTFAVSTRDVNDAKTQFTLALTNAAAGDVAQVQTVLLDKNDNPIPGVPPANPITLIVGA